MRRTLIPASSLLLVSFVLGAAAHAAAARPEPQVAASQDIKSGLERSRDEGLISELTGEPLSFASDAISGRSGSSRDNRRALCLESDEAQDLVDSYLATPNWRFPGRGSTVPGMSLAWGSRDCGTVAYAAGLRDIEEDEALTPQTLMGLASMTKPVIAAVTLKLNETGVFGPGGLDTTVDQLLTPEQIRALTIGDDPAHPRCPGSTYLLNRATLTYEWATFSCPDLSRVTLRNLMLSNHGMYDFVNEVLQPTGFSQWQDGMYFELFRALGFDPTPPVSSRDGFDYLKAFGLKRDESAVIGGDLAERDLEVSSGNTGFQLLGVILEQRTGKSLDRLVDRFIVKPLGIDDMFAYLDPERHGRIAKGYDAVTGDPLFEESGVYPIVGFHGHSLINNLSLGLGQPANNNLAGGTAGLVANPRSYRTFLDAFVNGGLLGPSGQAEFDDSFLYLPDISTPELRLFNGFGLGKASFRGIPGLVDFDWLSHVGRLAGIACENAVLLRPGTDIAPISAAMCINERRNAYPDPGIWWLRLLYSRLHDQNAYGGIHYIYSQLADASFKRLTRTVTVPAGGATLSFWTSYATEPQWDFVVVEAHTAGEDDWTTLPDLNGHTTTDTGGSCPAGWRTLHPQLDHYQTRNLDGTCSPAGTTGTWNAASGNSGGWQQWTVDLSPYAGQQVEISLGYVSDWGFQALGTSLDDIEVSTGEGSTSFERGFDGWRVTGPPPGSAPQPNDFVRATSTTLP
jgi:CubicO group peptidase (beta-lactamase class C family)